MNVQRLNCNLCFGAYNLQANRPVVTHCGHSFCRECATEWFAATGNAFKCPFCNASIPPTLADNIPLIDVIEQVLASQSVVPPRENEYLCALYSFAEVLTSHSRGTPLGMWPNSWFFVSNTMSIKTCIHCFMFVYQVKGPLRKCLCQPSAIK